MLLTAERSPLKTRQWWSNYTVIMAFIHYVAQLLLIVWREQTGFGLRAGTLAASGTAVAVVKRLVFVLLRAVYYSVLYSFTG